MSEKTKKNNMDAVNLEELLEKKDNAALRKVLKDQHAADIAEALIRLSAEDKIHIIGLMSSERASEVLVELDGQERYELIHNLDEKKLVQIIGIMDSDDAADVIGELDEEVAKRILRAMPGKELQEVRTLLRHDEETAGGIMALEIVSVNQKNTAAQALKVLRNKAGEVDDVYNIYVVDDAGILKGIASLQDVVLASPRAKLEKIMDREAVVIHTDLDQEEVANLFQKYNLVAAPVVDEKGRLVGRITVDDVLHVVEEEVSEDFTRMAGITDDDISEKSVFKISSVRLPWLLVAFVGEMISAKVLNHFVPVASGTLDNIILATLFIPLIMAMAGNIGIQSSTVIIRGLATGDIHLRDTGRRLIRESSVAFVNGLVIAVLLCGMIAVWMHQPRMGFVLGFALLIVLFVAGLTGTLVPLILKRFHVDPAIATGPFITTSNDVLGLIIYYSIVSSIGGA